MRIRKVAIASALAVAATIGLASPAFAINSVQCEFGPKGQLRFGWWDGFSERGACYVNAGTTGASINNVMNFAAGNNSGWFRYEYSDGNRYTSTFRHGDVRPSIQGIRRVYEIHIN